MRACEGGILILLGGPNRPAPGPRRGRGMIGPAMTRPPALARAACFVTAALAALVLAAPPAAAQLFFSSEAGSAFRIGPLIVRASVAPGSEATDINVLWSVILPSRQASIRPQDLYLLWPGEVTGSGPTGKPEPALAKAVADLGFEVIGEGRLPLYTQSLS